MHWLLDRIRDFGERPSLAMPTGAVSFADLARRTEERLREMDANGVVPGESAGIVGDHSPESVSALLACLVRGCVAVPLTGVNAVELAKRCDTARVTFLFNGPATPRTAMVDTAEPLLGRLRAAHRPGLVLFSSGTSGEPKAMVHDLETLAESYRDRRAKSLSMVLFLLFDHIGGLNTLFNGLATGSTLVVPGARTPEAVSEAIARYKPAVLPASPTFLNLLLLSGCRERYDLSSLRMITYGTEPMPESLLVRLRDAFPSVKFIQTFGTSETGIAKTVSKSSDSLAMRFDDASLEWKVVDGELWLRSATRALGYIGQKSDRFTDDGWFRTGDSVTLDADGYLTVSGRLSERINVGGEKVMPAEVESVILEVPGVADVLVRGEPNPLTGQSVVAEVVAVTPGGSDELKRGIRSHCRTRLAAYKVPARVIFKDSLETSGRLKKVRKS